MIKWIEVGFRYVKEYFKIKHYLKDTETHVGFGSNETKSTKRLFWERDIT